MDPITTGASAAGRAASAAISAASDPLITVRAGGREDIHVRCDRFEDALFDYFYHPGVDTEVVLRQSHLKLARRCTDEPTRAAAWTLMCQVVDFRDPPSSTAERDAAIGDYGNAEHEEWLYNTVRRRHGAEPGHEEQLYAWIEEFHAVVRRGRLVRIRETAVRWVRVLSPRRMLGR